MTWRRRLLSVYFQADDERLTLKNCFISVYLLIIFTVYWKQYSV